MKIGKSEKFILDSVAKGLFDFYLNFDPRMKYTLEYHELTGDRQKKYQTKKRIEKLIDKNLITLSGDVIKLSRKGEELLKEIDLKDFEICIPSTWDGVWHVISYDFPVEMKNERNYFQRKLKKLNFYQLQKSFWVFPYECSEEISVFAHSLKLSPYVMYLTTSKIPNENKVLEHFKLNK